MLVAVPKGRFWRHFESPNRPKNSFLPNPCEYTTTKAFKSRPWHQRRCCGVFIWYSNILPIVFGAKYVVFEIFECLKIHKNNYFSPTNTNYMKQKLEKVVYTIREEFLIVLFGIGSWCLSFLEPNGWFLLYSDASKTTKTIISPQPTGIPDNKSLQKLSIPSEKSLQ